MEIKTVVASGYSVYSALLITSQNLLRCLCRNLLLRQHLTLVEDSSLGGDGAGSTTLSSPAAESSLPIAISDTPPTEPPKPTAATLKIGTLNEQTRDRWIETILTNLSPGLRLLDAGCGEQQYKRFCSHLTYVGQDFGEYNGEGDSLGLQTGAWDNSKLDIVSDITAIPEPDNSFDVILCTEVFEHIPNPIAALEEFTRLLRPGGQLILTAPFCSLTHFSPFHFHSGFNVYFYEHALGKLGYKLTEVDRNVPFISRLRSAEFSRVDLFRGGN